MIRQILQPCNHQSPSWPRPEGPSCGGRRGPRTVCITIPRHIHATLVGYRRLSGAHYVFLCIPTYTPKLGRAKQSAPKSPSPHLRAGASALSRPHWARQRAKPKLGEAARQAQASNQSSILMQLIRFACMPSFMRRPSWRMLSRYTSCSMHMNSLRAGSPAPASPPRSSKLRRAMPKPQSPQLRGEAASEAESQCDAAQWIRMQSLV